MPLAYFSLDDLTVSLQAVAFMVFAMAFAGAMAFHLLKEIGMAVASVVLGTRWFNRRQAALFWRLAHDDAYLMRYPLGQREKQRQRLLARCGKHADKAQALEDLARYRGELRDAARPSLLGK